MFEAFYRSAWQHPGLAFLGGLPWLVLGLVAAQKGRDLRDPDPRRRAWVALFLVLQIEILLDTWLTGALSPFGAVGSAATAAAVAFVILGDLRFFYLVERQRGPAACSQAASLRALAVAVPLSLVVPALSQVLRIVDSARFDGHMLYLAYEAAMVGLCVAYTLFRLRGLVPTDARDGRARYVRRLLAFEVAQYALWATADALILLGWDLGYLLRLVPNFMYYVAFVPVATLRAPDGARA